MKSVLGILTVMALPLLAQAGDNGSYMKCQSASGRTELIIGNVDSGANPRTVELKIDRKSLGAAEIDNEVIETVQGTQITYTEADHDGDNWLTIRQLSQSGNGRSKYLILSGLDPRTGQPLDKQIEVSCRIVYNPI